MHYIWSCNILSSCTFFQLNLANMIPGSIPWGIYLSLDLFQTRYSNSELWCLSRHHGHFLWHILTFMSPVEVGQSSGRCCRLFTWMLVGQVFVGNNSAWHVISNHLLAYYVLWEMSCNSDFNPVALETVKNWVVFLGMLCCCVQNRGSTWIEGSDYCD